MSKTVIGIDLGSTLSECSIIENGKPVVIVNEEGPDHCKTFTARVDFNGMPLATASGRSKKAAEMAAAKAMLENIN